MIEFSKVQTYPFSCFSASPSKNAGLCSCWFRQKRGLPFFFPGIAMETHCGICHSMLIGNLARQLYNTADSIVVGKYMGDTAELPVLEYWTNGKKTDRTFVRSAFLFCVKSLSGGSFSARSSFFPPRESVPPGSRDGQWRWSFLPAPMWWHPSGSPRRIP